MCEEKCGIFNIVVVLNACYTPPSPNVLIIFFISKFIIY